MRIYVITLADAQARQQQAKSQLQVLGLDFRFFPAVTGEEAIRSPLCRIDEGEFLLATGRDVTAGEVGCYTSHRLLWRLCARLGEPVLVMEDDFQLSEDFPQALQLLDREIYEYGLIRLQSERRARKERVKPLGGFTLWRYTKAPHSAMCYGISPSAAERLLACSQTIAAPVDVYMKRFWRHGQQIYGITPYSVTESKLSQRTQIAGRSKAKKSLGVQLNRLFARVYEHLTRMRFNFELSHGKRFQFAGRQTRLTRPKQAGRTPA